MVRRNLLGAATIVAMTAATALSALAQPAPFEPPRKAGWTFLALSDNTLVYVKTHAIKGPIRQVWTLYELPAKRERQGLTFMSVASLGEFNCTEQTTRTVEESFYEQAGMTGMPLAAPPFTPTPWVHPEDGSVGAMKMDFACASGTLATRPLAPTDRAQQALA